MSQADTENSGLSAKRSLGTVHLFRDHRYWCSGHRISYELAQVFIRPWGPMTSLFFWHVPVLQDGAGRRRDRSRRLKSPHTQGG